MLRRKSKYDGYFHAGQRFGDWTVNTGEVSLDERGRATVRCFCRCSTNNLHNVSCRHLATGKTQRCKRCNYSKRYRTENPNWKGSPYVPKSVLTNISHSAINSHHAYNLSLAYATDLYNSASGTCTFTGYPITPGETGTIVRLNPENGYVVGNVAWAHTSVASTVNKMGAQQFTSTCYTVYANTVSKKE